jgi:peptidyl-tRNA hydrolase ICT1
MSAVHRSQAQNIDECLQKVILIFFRFRQSVIYLYSIQLHDLVVQAASKSIVNAPSMEQKKKVEDLVKMEQKRRKAQKMKRSDIKQNRKGGRGGWDY